MSRADVFAQVTEIFRDVFDNETLCISENTHAGDIEDWDSLEQINLLVLMEKRFSIKFSLEEVAVLQNVGEMVSLIVRKLESN